MIRLTAGKIAVDPMFDPDEAFEGGIIVIPDHLKGKVDQGIVRYIGPDVVHDIRIGDHVLFSAYSGTTIRVEGEGLLIILHSDFITCVLESPDTEVPGLYFYDGEQYWPATREMATKFIADAVGPTGEARSKEVPVANLKRGI